MGGQVDQLEVSFSACGGAQDTNLAIQPFVPPTKDDRPEPDTPQWRAYCAWAASDEAAAGRLDVLRVFPDEDRELLLEAENRLKRQSDQIAALRKGAYANRSPLRSVPDNPGISSLARLPSSTPITPRISYSFVQPAPTLVAAPYAVPVTAVPSLGSSTKRTDTSRGLWPSGSGKWTLWASAGADIQQREFSSEAEAREAFSWTRRSCVPCSLRDPCGAEVASESWNPPEIHLREVGQPLSARGSLQSMPVSMGRLTPPRRSMSPVRYVSPPRMAPRATVSNVTPPRRDVPQLQISCSAVAMPLAGILTPPSTYVPARAVQCW